jgi:UDP-N-acetylmuramoyl-L-alanyl-D-glutamate--2,6-diaminopimelate ligase
MKLKDVLVGCSCGHMDRVQLETEITGIAYDSRKVEAGNIFVAVRGEHYDGHDYIADAVKRGASAVVCEKEFNGGGKMRKPEGSPILIRVRESRDALACMSNNFYRRPSSEVPVIGVTGTNGKTTTTYLVKSVVEKWGKAAGLIGTVCCLIRDEEYPSFYTTPEAPEFQRILRNMISSGCTNIVAEVSSHALFQKRADYTKFSAAVFTNLTIDHLDFHGTMEGYFSAKKRLFTDLLADEGTAVINVDDEWGRKLFSEIEIKRDVMTYGLGAGADISAEDIVDSLSGVSFLLTKMGKGIERIHSPLVGVVNVYNTLAAVAVSFSLGVPVEVIAEGVGTVKPVQGRLEKVEAGQGFLCLVDYAHTPDALERVIGTVKGILTGTGNHGRVITVFGCGGNRDRRKRPLMGWIATRTSDSVIITSDNPRMEEPIEIIREIISGASSDNYVAIPDRREAIHKAVNMANPGDIVVIAGKGHENYQEIKGIRYPFDDREIAGDAIRGRN